MSLTNDQITAKNFKDFYNQIRPYLNGEAHAGFTPVGTVISVMGKTAPQNYLVCDGTAYNIADYPELAAYFVEQFESVNFFGGDGTTTFAVPDLRGEFLRGSGTNSHANQGSGANVGEHQDGTVFNETFTNNNQTNLFTAAYGINNAYQDSIIANNLKRALANSSLAGTEAGINYTSRPTNTSVLYCIKAVVAGEVYSTDERIVGTWIDGKKIYQKSIEITQIPNKNVVTINHNIANIDRITDIKGICFAKPSIDANYSSSLVPRIQDNATNANMTVDVTRVSVIVKGRGEEFSGLYDEIVVTFQYTKTTD